MILPLPLQVRRGEETEAVQVRRCASAGMPLYMPLQGVNREKSPGEEKKR